jgi:hypothetical protein
MPRRTADDRVKLLHEPYRAPRVQVGEQADCLYRDCPVVVTGWTDARFSWPRALPVGRMGHPSVLVNDELARTVRHESAAAVCFWWGVSEGVIHRWRKALRAAFSCPVSAGLGRLGTKRAPAQHRGAASHGGVLGGLPGRPNKVAAIS